MSIERAGGSVTFSVTVHYDNSPAFAQPHLWAWYDSSLATEEDLAPAGTDAFGPCFRMVAKRKDFSFKFKDGPDTTGPWEGAKLDRRYEAIALTGPDTLDPGEVWVRGSKAFVYPVEPRTPEPDSALQLVSALPLKDGVFMPNSGGISGLGATPLGDGRVLFGCYHPNAARMYVMGSFNDWQRPGADNEDPTKFLECQLHRGYFGLPNTWLLVTDRARVGDEYKFFAIGGVPRDRNRRVFRNFPDPYSRQLGPDFGFNNSVICDPTTFQWNEGGWQTPDIGGLIVYELSVHGFTDVDPNIPDAERGRFQGIIRRIESGYFNDLGVTALSLMPLAEVPDIQGPNTLGYSTSLFCAVERDFGVPDDLRALVDAAHRKGLVVLLDQVFNHTSNDFNPLYKLILEHPGEEPDPAEGGLYFNGATPWGNRVATEKEDVQNMLIDACRLYLTEYHVDGFRFDATNTNYMDHGFVLRLADELKRFKPSVLLVAENLPNQPDLNRAGFDGFAQWCDPFHDKMKAMLREGVFQDSNFYSTDGLGSIFFFSHDSFAAHTNNVVNYCHSHDEHSTAFEVGTNPILNNGPAKDRKGRLGLISTMTALGQPMIYMGAELNQEQARNIVTVRWPQDFGTHGFYQWARRLIRLRSRYPGLKLRGYNPAETGQFAWIVAPWLDQRHGGGERAVGWRSRVNQLAHDAIVVLLNFENHDVTVDLELGIPGFWVKLADIDTVNDVAPEGSNSAGSASAMRSADGRFTGFVMPSSSGFVYKWEGAI
jgi:1,4-alpha-glucan branching enzyme